MRILLISSLAAAALTLGGCGLRPLYANGSQGAVAQILADVDVAAIEGHSGWLVRNALRDRLQATQGGQGAGKRLRLDVRLEDSITGFGVRADDAVTRERRTLRARYQLVDAASAAKCCSTRPRRRTPGSTSSAANMRRSPPNRRRSNGSPRGLPTRLSRGLRSMQTAGGGRTATEAPATPAPTP